MAFIRLQKVKTGEDGRITGGTAAVVDVIYVPGGGKNHSKQKVRERLGLPIYIADDGKSGIFDSPTRGIVEYNAATDTFSEVSSNDMRLACFVEKQSIHTVFGDAYLFLFFLKKSGMAKVLRRVLTRNEDFERCILHLYHKHMSNASRDRCDLFCEKSFISRVLPSVPLTTLRSDTFYFEMMGDDKVRTAFFTEFAARMRLRYPGFGKSCYVDSTPLPNDICDNPFNAFCSHGTDGAVNQTRLILVLDDQTGIPVWFKLIPGNVTDVQTLKAVADDVAVSLDISMNDFVLDAGYASESLVSAYGLGEYVQDGDPDHHVRDTEESWEVPGVVYEPPAKKMLVRMPLRKGYGAKELFNGIKPLLNNAKYDFVRNGHAYFGKRRKHVLFGKKVYAYVYIDQNNALDGYRRFLGRDSDELDNMKDKDKTWQKYRSGFFVLISNLLATPAEILDMYFGRTDIECVFKTSKEYLRLLPLKKWTVRRVEGKILSDMVSLILFLEMRSTLSKTEYPMTEVPTRLQSLICSVDAKGVVRPDPPNKQVREICRYFSADIPARTDLDTVRGFLK